MEANEVLTAKEHFIKEELPVLYARLEPGQMGRWGKMNAQQMVEHMSDFIRIASGKYKVTPALSPEITQKSYTFMMTDRPFRENTPNPTLGTEPEPVKNVTMADAIAELKMELANFFAVYEAQPALRNLNPIFGELNYGEQVHLLHKHGMHHARQFGLVE